MKKLLAWTLAVLVTAGFTMINAEGKVHGKIFTNFHYDLTKDVDKVAAFEVQRAYFGYSNQLDDKFSVKLTYDIGHAGGKYHAFLKVAALKWKIIDPLSLDFGLIGLKQFKDQEKMWGNRYVYKSFMDANSYGSSADLGLNLDVKLHKMAGIFITLINGEGYKSKQDDFGQIKLAAGTVLKPIEGLVAKVYFDMYSTGDTLVYTSSSDTVGQEPVARNVVAIFVGYEIKDMLRVGFEYNMLMNNNYIKDNKKNGISAYAAYIINKQMQVFGRYDMATSDPSGTATTDGALVAGLQYQPTEKVKIAPNLQMSMPDGGDSSPKVYINFEYKL